MLCRVWPRFNFLRAYGLPHLLKFIHQPTGEVRANTAGTSLIIRARLKSNPQMV